MGLNIQTFSNAQGGNSLFKALGHPLAADNAWTLVERLSGAGPVAVYDPYGYAETFGELYDLKGWNIESVYVQRVTDLNRSTFGIQHSLITELSSSPPPRYLLVANFDAERTIKQIEHLIPRGVNVISFDDMRLPDTMLTNRKRYLDPLNFATNYGFLREGKNQHTRITMCDFWSGYGASSPRVWLCLFDLDGRILAQWTEEIEAPGSLIVIDSRQVRERFSLGDFTGSLFIHAVNVAGHDIVKYALDTYGDKTEVISCTHDANAWPSDLYAGLPAPAHGETVLLWIQNCHPHTIPAGAIGLSLMGSTDIRTVQDTIPPFACYALDVADLFPDVAWPQQYEIHAGKYFMRPRYEVFSSRTGRSRIAHANVERNDLKPDAQLPALGNIIGTGYILPAPVLPPDTWRTVILPTPMSTAQNDLPLSLQIYDASGKKVFSHFLGNMPRNECTAIDVSALLEKQDISLPGGYGHLELVYDFSAGGSADGWMHALFRYEHKRSGHIAESSFGAHMFNIPVVYRNEPQSYTGNPPGLSTRLFLRNDAALSDTVCQLIYPSSQDWHPRSRTSLTLCDNHGRTIASREVEIPCHGSLLWRGADIFDEHACKAAKAGSYVMIRDVTCRLFGYHAIMRDHGSFSLDHMFGF